MTWPKLSGRLATLPRVLAGPMLRKVDETGVTVWLAMRVGATVTLVVNDAQGVRVMQGGQRSVAIGKHLHIVAVKAKMLVSGEKLSEGIVYRYDLTFAFDGVAQPANLTEATGSARLGYPTGTRPSFSLPPRDLNLLRLFQGSCRKPSGDSVDMLRVLDDQISESANNAYARPHQLLLTGDQIYADDVTDVLRLVITDAAETLLGWDEQLPVGGNQGNQRTIANLHAARRWMCLKEAGFTGEDLRHHLFSLGEYLAMYLFAWSPVLWPSSLPTYQDVLADFDADWPQEVEAPEMFAIADMGQWRDQKSFDTQAARVRVFAESLSKVRCALANIPSYMIFDDHEVTDDWNMTREFCSAVYGNELGLRVVQNGLAAFALCQHWGNVPEVFLPEAIHPPEETPPGAALLVLLDTKNPTAANAFAGKAAEYDRISPGIRKVLGIQNAAAIRARLDRAVFHDGPADSLRYNFTVEGPGHQVIFADTRTWRSYPVGRDNPYTGPIGTSLLAQNRQTDQFKEQILNTPVTGDRLLMVVLTTNAPPVQPIRAGTRHDSIANFKEHYPDLYEAWDLPSLSFDRLLVALSSKLPVDDTGRHVGHVGAVLLLSGDVHHSYATRIMYRATQRFEDDVRPRPATAVFAQLVASALKNQSDGTIRFQREGYYAAPAAWITRRMIRKEMTEGYVGWNFPKGQMELVGSWPLPIAVDKQTIDVTRGETLDGRPNSNRIVLNRAPHYRYRLDYLLPTEQDLPLPPLSEIPAPPSGSSLEDRKNAARFYDALKLTHLKVNRENPPKVVGFNNIGEMRIEWGDPSQRKVKHILRWWDPVNRDVRRTTYSVRLDLNSPDDPQFPDIKASIERQ